MPAAQLGRTSQEARQTLLEVVLAAPVSAQVVLLAFRQASLEQGQLAPVWLAVQQIWLEVARAVLVWAQAVPPAFRQTLPEWGQQPPVDCDSAERSRQLAAVPEQAEQVSLGRLVSRQQSA